MKITEYCPKCDKIVRAVNENHLDITKTLCTCCGQVLDLFHNENEEE